VSSASGGKFGTNTFSTVQADINDIQANYNSLQTSLERRVAHGITVLLNYTYSKSLDDLPFGEGVTGFDTGYSALPITNPLRHQFDYGPSSFDHANVFTGSYVWQTPTLKNSNSWVRHMLGDFEFAGIVSAASGRPITVLQGTEISGTGIGNDRGTLIAGSNPYSKNSCAGVTATCVSWLNPNAFYQGKRSQQPSHIRHIREHQQEPIPFAEDFRLGCAALEILQHHRTLQDSAPRRVLQRPESS
jgi:hypothetical protein